MKGVVLDFDGKRWMMAREAVFRVIALGKNQDATRGKRWSVVEGVDGWLVMSR